ncbi:hypothetical protein H6G45_09170 [Synechocystis sp. FACHB-383]|uniref:hypothetical protein n=1 Tax=Synechocystis sp. FACHB-383 TaxID=2692864 RepID=UPI001687902D|nr:hypothetical protein [Synechocystis sp. FACHB-383]MBD2653656.1 hypothetical protein [Synechocystis sp. FACHB-383]
MNGKQPLKGIVAQLITKKQLVATDEYFQLLRPLENNTVVKLPNPDGLGYCEFEIVHGGNGVKTLKIQEFDGTPVVDLNKYGEDVANTGLRAIYVYFFTGVWYVWERGFFPFGVDLDEELIPGETNEIDPEDVNPPGGGGGGGGDEGDPEEPPVEPDPVGVLTIDSTNRTRFNAPITGNTDIDFVYNRFLFFRLVYLSLDYLGGDVQWDSAIIWPRGEPELIPGVRHYFFFLTLNRGNSWIAYQYFVEVSPIAWSGSESGFCQLTPPSYGFTWDQQTGFDAGQSCTLTTPDYSFTWNRQEQFDLGASCELTAPDYSFTWDQQTGFDNLENCDLETPDYEFVWTQEDGFDECEQCELEPPDYTITQDPN